jgi:hypothetical protein
MTSKAGLARMAGSLYLILAVCGGFSQLYVRSSVRAPGDAAATAQNIADSATLFRIAFATDLVNITCFVLVALTLYALLKSVNPGIAVAMLVFNAVSVAIMSANMLNHAGALVAATSADYSAAFGAETSKALSMLFLDLHGYGYSIAQIFFGLWLLPLGYLVYASGFLPRALGVVLMVGCFSYLADLPVAFLFPDLGSSLSVIIATPAAIAELALILWLLVKGVSIPRRQEQVLAAA